MQRRSDEARSGFHRSILAAKVGTQRYRFIAVPVFCCSSTRAQRVCVRAVGQGSARQSARSPNGLLDHLRLLPPRRRQSVAAAACLVRNQPTKNSNPLLLARSYIRSYIRMILERSLGSFPHTQLRAATSLLGKSAAGYNSRKMYVWRCLCRHVTCPLPWNRCNLFAHLYACCMHV